MILRKLLFTGLALLALCAGAGLPTTAQVANAESPAGVAWQADPGAEFVATPMPAACVAAVQRPSLNPGLTEIDIVPTTHGRDAAVEPAIQLQAAVVSAQVFEKYRSFRESLSTP